MKKIVVIGDVHGCYDELLLMMDKINNSIHEFEHIVFVGDYIDRGPKSKEVFNYVQDIPNVVMLKGNHEDMMCDHILRGHFSSWLLNGGGATGQSYDFDEDKMYDDALIMDKLPLYFQFGRVIVSHAGIDPTLELEDQSAGQLIWDRDHVGYNGQYVNNYFSVFGHTPVNEIMTMRNQLGIDTGCVFGYKLSAVVLDEEANLIDTFKVAKIKSDNT